jgi:hypothetical protein|tara:strand:+ start:874 stop:1569 length:696 start_codon:yes stop_codon:yes gene_type:complete|mmetsp:Transcript_6268/g.22953  ORF Transcript_6268/g.22953 Transcript_6268/m.22953 type:complete len:232 (+) Transcript_6268:308-1003(+)
MTIGHAESEGVDQFTASRDQKFPDRGSASFFSSEPHGLAATRSINASRAESSTTFLRNIDLGSPEHPELLKKTLELTEKSSDAVECKSVRDALMGTGNGRYLVLQLPHDLDHSVEFLTMRSPGEAVISQGKADANLVTDSSIQDQLFEPTSHKLSSEADRQVGELTLQNDGTVEVRFTDAEFDVLHGSSYAHSEQFTCIDSLESTCTFLGQVRGRLVCVPCLPGPIHEVKE